MDITTKFEQKESGGQRQVKEDTGVETPAEHHELAWGPLGENLGENLVATEE